MQSKTYNTIVIMPNDIKLEVTYYCDDLKLEPNEKEIFTRLYIQLDDCLCIMKIEKSTISNQSALEGMVHNKVIHERGHLC